MGRVDNIRIGNVELRTSLDLKNNEYYDIVMHYNNDLYDKMSEYITDDGERYYKKEFPNQFINRNMFLDKEHAYSIAYFQKDGEDYNLISVGSRLWTISKNDWDNLYTILGIFQERLQLLNY